MGFGGNLEFCKSVNWQSYSMVRLALFWLTVYTVFQKCGVELFAITSSTVLTDFKHYCWKQQWIVYKINMIFLAIS